MTDQRISDPRSFSAIEAIAVEDERPPDVLICVHGMRDSAAWGSAIVTVTVPGSFVDKTIEVACVNYNRLSTFNFLLGRKKKLIHDDVLDQIEFIRSQFPKSPISIICHSTGTKIVAELMPRLEFPIEWLFLCGSICRLEDVKSLRIAKRYPVNDAATKDWWPIVAEIILPCLYQATGVYGFHCFPVIERMFAYHHGGGTHRAHIERWVLPTILHGSIERTEIRKLNWKIHAPTYIRRALLGFLLILLLLYLLT